MEWTVNNICPLAERRLQLRKMCRELLMNNTLVLFVMSCLLSLCGGDWCNLDTGHTTIQDGRGNPHAVYISRTRDGAVWARLGPSRRSLDWFYTEERKHRVHTTILDQDSLSFLRAIHYMDYCVVSDIVLQVWAEAGWHPSYLSVFDAETKETKIVSFKKNDNCFMHTNFSLSADKQGLYCDGGRTNTCGLRRLPERRHHTDTLFLNVVRLDPQGEDHSECSGGDGTRNMYTFHGSYYHVYVKLSDCTAPWESRAFGHEAKLRALQDNHENTVIVPDPTQTSLSDGVIKGWQVFNKIVSIEHEVYLQVWRPTKDQMNIYTLVGETFYQPQELRFHEVVLSPDMYIRVRKGDVLGLYFPKYNPIAWSSVPCAYRLQRYKYIEGPSDVQISVAKQFVEAQGGWDACRQYSFTAVFANKTNAKLVDDWVCPTAQPPFGPQWKVGEHNRDNTMNDYPNTGSGNMDINKGRGHPVNHRYNGIIPLHLILIIAGCLILMLIIIGLISYYRAIKS